MITSKLFIYGSKHEEYIRIRADNNHDFVLGNSFLILNEMSGLNQPSPKCESIRFTLTNDNQIDIDYLNFNLDNGKRKVNKLYKIEVREMINILIIDQEFPFKKNILDLFNISAKNLNLNLFFNPKQEITVLHFLEVDSKSLNSKLEKKFLNFRLYIMGVTPVLLFFLDSNFNSNMSFSIDLKDEAFFIDNNINNNIDVKKILDYLKQNESQKEFFEKNKDYIEAILERIQTINNSKLKLKDISEIIVNDYLKKEKSLFIDFFNKFKSFYLTFKNMKFKDKKDIENHKKIIDKYSSLKLDDINLE